MLSSYKHGFSEDTRRVYYSIPDCQVAANLLQKHDDIFAVHILLVDHGLDPLQVEIPSPANWDEFSQAKSLIPLAYKQQARVYAL